MHAGSGCSLLQLPTPLLPGHRGFPTSNAEATLQVETGPCPHHIFLLRAPGSGPHDALPPELRGALRLPGKRVASCRCLPARGPPARLLACPGPYIIAQLTTCAFVCAF